jgi:hypothetical protein
VTVLPPTPAALLPQVFGLTFRTLVPILSQVTVLPPTPAALLPQVFGLTFRNHSSPLLRYSSHSWFYFPNNIVTFMSIVRQPLCKHITKHTRSAIGLPLLRNGPINKHSSQQKTVFSVGSVPMSYGREQSEDGAQYNGVQWSSEVYQVEADDSVNCCNQLYKGPINPMNKSKTSLISHANPRYVTILLLRHHHAIFPLLLQLSPSSLHEFSPSFCVQALSAYVPP